MKTHAIHWVSTANGKAGTGTKLFEKEEAERLASELNESYPEIDHDAILCLPPLVEAAMEPPPADVPHSTSGLASCPQAEAEVPLPKSLDELSE